MSSSHPTQVKGEKVKKAIARFAELLELHPQKSRQAILNDVVVRYDLSPLECEFLHKHFSDSKNSSED